MHCRCSVMRSMLFTVLALWLLSESRGYGKQGMVDKGVLLLDAVEQRREEASMLISNVSDGTVSNKPTRNILPTLSHDNPLGAKGVVLSDITDRTTANKQSSNLLLDRDVVCMLIHDTQRGGQGQTRSFAKTALEKKVNVPKCVALPMRSQISNTPVALHEKGRWGQSHISLLELVEGTSAGKQASSGQQLYVHTSSQDRHAIRMLSHAVRLGTKGHISQRDAIAETPAGKQANAVRRQGVDNALFKYAELKLSADPQTGVIFDVGLPPTLTGIQAQVTRLNPATFKQAGLIFNEFTLPPGASFDPTSALVTMVYRKISTFTVYTLPLQYQFGGPVVGIISSASNSTSVDGSLPQAKISLSPDTFINISLPMSNSTSNSISNMLCAFFASNGSIFVSNLASSPNVCVSSTLGDFALVIQAPSTPSSTQNPPPPLAAGSPSINANEPLSSSTTSKVTKNWKLVVGATCLALGGLAFLVAVILISIKLADSCKFFFTTRFTGNEEALQHSLIGSSKAPTAAVMRTKPALEIDMAHFTNQMVA